MSEQERTPPPDGGMTRRTVVLGGGALAAGLVGGAAAGFGIGRATADEEAATTAAEAAAGGTPGVFAKQEGTTLKVFGTELGTPWYDQSAQVTPHELFFVRNRYPSPKVDAASWKLEVKGNAIETPLTITYDELRAMPSRAQPRILECFGNGRTVNREQLGYESRGATGASVPSARASGTTCRSRRSSTASSRRRRRSSCCSGAESTVPTRAGRSR